MAIKLKLALQKLHLLLAGKAVLFVLLLIWVKASDFGWLPVSVFILTVGFLFARHLFQTLTFAPDFLLLLALALVFLHRLPASLTLLGALFFGGLWYLLLGVKDLDFVNRDRAYAIFNFGLLYVVLLLFFATSLATFFFAKLFGLFLVTSVLFGQLIKFRRPLTNSVLALLLVEIVWATALLPIGFFQASNLSFLAAVFLVDLTLHSFRGDWSVRFGFKRLLLFLGLLIILLLFSRWRF